MKNLSTRELVICASLAAISAVLQLIHVGYQFPQWGVWLDFVSVSWIIAFFLFSLRASLFVSLLGAITITLFAPDTWLGASMKFVATVPMLIGLYVWMRFKKQDLKFFENRNNLIIPLMLGVLIRCLVVIPLNYFYAIPIWTGMTSSQALSAIPWYVIAVFNVTQGIIDVVLAWILVFTYKLSRFSNWK